jgi:hypothetical protein
LDFLVSLPITITDIALELLNYDPSIRLSLHFNLLLATYLLRCSSLAQDFTQDFTVARDFTRQRKVFILITRELDNQAPLIFSGAIFSVRLTVNGSPYISFVFAIA